jgi:outer membrane protein OmpA-like peptidoglycan-associated protein
VKTIIIFLFFISYFAIGIAQNIIPNYSFEQHHGDRVAKWAQPTGPNYHNHKTGEFGNPYDGEWFSGICVSNTEYSEAMGIRLLEPLKAGRKYFISMYIRKMPGTLSTYNFDVCDEIQVYFTDKPPNIFSPVLYPIDTNQLIRIKLPVDESILEWTYIEGEYVAKGGESIFTLGYLALPDPNKPIKPFYLTNLDFDDDNDGNLSKKEQKKKVKILNNPIIKSYENAYEPFRVRYYFDNVCLIEKVEGKDYYDCGILVNGEAEIDTVIPKPIPGKRYVLHNIFFDFDQSRILPASYKSLDSLVNILNGYPDIRILIKGFTDNFGTPEYNLRLSEQRALSVMNYLIQKGIKQERLSYQGYGEKFPIATNETDKGRLQNRRVEFEVLDE